MPFKNYQFLATNFRYSVTDKNSTLLKEKFFWKNDCIRNSFEAEDQKHFGRKIISSRLETFSKNFKFLNDEEI